MRHVCRLILDLHYRKPIFRVWGRHFHLCHLLTATSDLPQTLPTTSVKTLLLQVFWRALKTTVTAQSRESLRQILCAECSHAPVWDIPLISYLIRSEFAANKLKKSGYKGNTFLLRQSPKTYDNFFLTVCVKVGKRFLLQCWCSLRQRHVCIISVYSVFLSAQEHYILS